MWPLTFSQALDVRRHFLWASGKAKTDERGAISHNPVDADFVVSGTDGHE
jgi:hypothetical protein